MKELRESILDDDFVNKVELPDIYNVLNKKDVDVSYKTNTKFIFSNPMLLKPRSAERKQLKETLRFAIGPVQRDGDGVRLVSIDQDILIDAFIKWIEPFLNTTGKYIINKYKDNFQVGIFVFGKNSDPGTYRIGNNAGITFSLEFKDGPSYKWNGSINREFPCIMRVDVITWNKAK